MKQLQLPNANQIDDLIKAREAEKQSVIDQHNAMWEKGTAELKALAEKHQAIQTQMQQAGGQNQLKITHLEGCIAELKKLLPTKKPK